ncbi:MAG: DUF1583 domain-containing protein [Isosphaeraceae bacterium]|nr:DUF1583 domain-containing protein [Isosphaeraceae bacterium]
MRFQRAAVWLCFGLALGTTTPAPAQDRPPDDPQASAEEERERKVMERFAALLEKSPRRGTALDRVYGYHVERGTLDGYVKTLQARTAAHPDDGGTWLLLGLLEAQRGRDAAAVTALRQAETQRPGDALPSYYLGQALVLVGQPDAAAEALERAIARKPTRQDLLEIYQALGRIYQRAHRTEQALGVWSRLEAQFPDDLRVKEQIADILAEESQNEPALKRYNELVAKVTDPYRKVQLRVEAAELKVRLGKSPDALADFESLLGQLNPDSWLYREVRRKIEEVFLRNDDLAGLALYYEGWVKKAPEDVEALARLGRTLAQQGRAAEARTWLEKAVKLAPKRRELRLALIEQLVQDKKIKEAEQQYEALSKNEPNNPDVIREWGRMILRDASRPEPERKQAAAAVWMRLAQARENDAVVTAQVADLLRQAELIDEAVALYKKAIALAPGDPQYREYLGEYYHTLKRPDEALATWREIAAGKNRSAKTLGRLAEVLAGFGYRKESVEPIAEAVALEPDNFELRTKQADLLFAVERYDDALKPLDEAEKLADNDEQRDAVLERQIKTYVAANTLADRTVTLQKELDAGRDASAAGWLRLARYYEAGQKLPEATAAVQRATRLDEKSIPAWAAAARIEESAGNLSAAVSAQRRLTALDRRARADYLTSIAKLEARLGRRDDALKAGRELLAASPGNPESHQFFADLCFQLGEVEDGLDALRRSVRSNPADPKVVLTLAEALAQQFRTDEASELFWRAFDKTKELDAKLGIVARLTELALQRNQLDKLVARFERLQREPNQEREMTLCLAQAYQSSGDYGTARQTVERLLGTNTRDTQLFQQLSLLAENEGDIAAAAKYQRQVCELASTDEGWTRLAQLYLRAGDMTEAEAVWARLAGGAQQQPGRVLMAADSLLSHGKREAVLAITEGLLKTDPKDWDALYREGVALAGLKRNDEAVRRFEAILDLHLGDGEESAIIKARKKAGPGPGRPAGTTAAASQRVRFQPVPIESRISSTMQIRALTGLETRYNYGPNFAWNPSDFGQARMAALAWLYSLGQKEGENPAFVARWREAQAKSPQDPRPLWDLCYLALVRDDSRELYNSAKDLATLANSDPEAQWLYLYSLGGRATTGNTPGVRVAPAAASGAVDRTPPLGEVEINRVLATYDALHKRRPEWVQRSVLANVAAELKRAKRVQDEERLYRDSIASANDPTALFAVLSAVAEKGDMEALIAILDKAERAEGSKASSLVAGNPYGAYGVPQTLAKAMTLRADARAYGDILRLLDRYDASQLLQQQQQQGQRRRSSLPNPNATRNYVQIWTNPRQLRAVQLDFPGPNDLYDLGSIQLLRNAYELFRRGDLLSDLVSHYRAKAETGSDPQRLRARLALCYLHWWGEEKDESVKDLTEAVTLAKGDAELRLTLAELRERRGEVEEALAAVEAVEALDNALMQKRETAALRLAVMAGNVDRARTAAERLFGLRLDTELQIQLAAQMHQLGMHDLAEAVLARARRRAGNVTSALVSLMNQYQRQDKPDIAVQVAHQILRKGPGRPQQPGYYNEDDNARTEALRFLGRSGKLNEMIARAEAQVQSSPNAPAVLQTLADYYRAAGNKDKARATYERMVKLRPDDTRLRYQVAQNLVEAGDPAAAVEHYRAAIKAEPALFRNQYWQVENAFRAANKYDELVALVESLDVKALGQYSMLANITSNLLQDPKTRDQGLKLFRRSWQAFPNQRPSLIRNLYQQDLWQLPEIYDYARQAVIPSAEQTQVVPWAGLDSIMSWQGDGKVDSVLSRLLEAATKQGKIGVLERDVEAALKRFPEWLGGKALHAVLDLRSGRTKSAESAVTELLDDTASGISNDTCWILAQELENFTPTLGAAETLYKRAMNDEYQSRGLSYPNHPARRLVLLYRRSGRIADARELLVTLSKDHASPDYYDPSQAIANRANMLGGLATQLVDLGYPADAVNLFAEMMGEIEKLPPDYRYYPDRNTLEQQAQQGTSRAMQGLGQEALARTVATLLKPRPEAKQGEPALDLVLLVQPRDLEHARVMSLLAVTLQSAGDRPEVKAEVRAQLDRLKSEFPNDLSVHIADVLTVMSDGKADAIDAANGRLGRLMEAQPLDDLPKGTRANARQRAQAARQIGLWLAARACWSHDSARAVGDRLAARALEAARRQADPLWALAMYREWGQAALDHGDRAAAEKHWGAMLDLVLTAPVAPIAAPPGVAGTTTFTTTVRSGAPATKPSPATPKAAPAEPKKAEPKPKDEPAAKAKVKVSSARFPADRSAVATRRIIRRVSQLAQAVIAPPAPVAARAAPGPARGVSALAMERFTQAMQVAKLAADQGMHELSLRAVREALKGGPPVGGPQVNQAFGLSAAAARARRLGSIEAQPADASGPLVESSLAALDPLWEARKAPAADVYTALRDIVLPPSRNGEIFLYPRELVQGTLTPQSAGRLLCRWAVRAGRVDDLKETIGRRQASPLAELPAAVLLTQLGLEAHDDALAVKGLEATATRLKKDTLQTSTELACHAALAALDRSETGPRAAAILEQAVQAMASHPNEEPQGSLAKHLARYHFNHNQPEAGRAQLEAYLTALERSTIRYGGDYPLYLRKQRLASVAEEFARARLWPDALEALGRFADAPTGSNGDPPVTAALSAVVFYLAGLPAAERFDRLRTWTMPAANRRSVRLLTAFLPERTPPAAFLAADHPGGTAGTTLPASCRDGIASTARLLIEAAQGSGQLDALAAELQAADAQHVENAGPLLVLTQIARGQGRAVEARVKLRLEAVRKERGNNGPRSNARGVQWNDLLLAEACFEDSSLVPLGRDFSKELIEVAHRLWGNGAPFATHLNRSAALRQARVEDSEWDGGDPGLSLWHPSSLRPNPTAPHGGVPPFWVAAEGHVAHIGGRSDDYLYFDYPLEGSFEFSLDFYHAGWNEANAGYGGFVFEHVHGNSGILWPIGNHLPYQNQNVGVNPRRLLMVRPDDFNRLTIQVSPETVRYVVNGHTFYEDLAPSPTSPWLYLEAARERKTFYRNLALRGTPRIPREVRLTHADRLEGWVAHSYGESKYDRTADLQRGQSMAPGYRQNNGLRPEQHDWLGRDGLIIGRRLPSPERSAQPQGHLYYHRPLRDGDALTYEFYYEPGLVMAHPALDGIAFLIEPNGVRVHWMTDAIGEDWTGLRPDNAIEEAPFRRAKPPLKPGSWNVLSVRLKDGVASLALNGTSIYERPLESGNDRHFGFYHDRQQTEARVRNVVLKGDWPNALTPEQMANLLARHPGKPALAERRARQAIVGEEIFVLDSENVLRRARSQTPAARYETLAAWVLPGDSHAQFRLEGDFTPADPAPPVAPDTKALKGRRVHTGGALEAPALELVKVAKELDNLDALAQQVESQSTPTDHERRSQAALLALIRIAQERDDQAETLLGKLQPLLAGVAKDAPVWQRWPELVAATAALERPALLKPATGLLDEIVVEQLRKGHTPGTPWNIQAHSARARAHLLALPADQRRPLGVDPDRGLWSPVALSRASARGPGWPLPRWAARGGAFQLDSGHAVDELVFNTPLQGNFEVACELTSFDWREIRLPYAGLAVGLAGDRKTIDLFHYSRVLPRTAIDPPLSDVKDDRYQYKLVVHDGLYTALVNGHKIYERNIPTAYVDPWFTIISTSPFMNGVVRNVTITGAPVVPDALHLSALPDLTGWLADYYDDSVEGAKPAWEKRGEEILGRLSEDINTAPSNNYEEPVNGPASPRASYSSQLESVLQYHRPMLEDGAITYEFYYEPGKAHTHPALDRLALLLEPDGVAVHWLTDGKYDRTGLPADNRTVEPEHRRGPKALPLKPQAWNRAGLKLTGDTITLLLNDTLIYERPIEATNQRNFGLFHYADQSEVRVRNVVYKGNWPRTLNRQEKEGLTAKAPSTPRTEE